MARLEDLPPERVADAVAKAVVDAVGGGGDTETIVARALARVKGELGLGAEGPLLRLPVHPQPRSATAPRPSGHSPSPPTQDGFRRAPLGSGKLATGSIGTGRPLLTEGDVLAALDGGLRELRLASGTIVTALARDTARDAGVRLVED